MTILTKKCFTLLGWLATGMIVTPAMSMHVRKGVPLFCFVLSVVFFLILFDLVWFPLVWFRFSDSEWSERSTRRPFRFVVF
jgi:hypothetical protein